MGILASLSVPLLIGALDEKQELLGSLNIYSETASAFDPFDAQLMRLYTAAAGQAISDATQWQDSREAVTQLEKALLFRSDIDMAKGALIALPGYNPGDWRDWWTNLNGETSRCATSLPKCSTGCKQPRNCGPSLYDPTGGGQNLRR